MQSRFLCVLFLTILIAMSITSNAQGKKWAVLVGINNYSSDDITQLHYPVNDAKAVAQVLQRSAGFLNDNVFVMTSDISSGSNMPTRHNVIKRLNALSALVGPQDTFLFYFSGHGFQREGGNSYLATVDADSASTVDLEESTISLKALQEQIKKVNARQVIFMIDACRNDPEKSKGEAANNRKSAFTKGLIAAARSAGKGQASTGVFFACSEGERAWEWDDVKQGTFTYFLLQGLRGKAVKGNELTLADLASYVQVEVSKWGHQHNRPLA